MPVLNTRTMLQAIQTKFLGPTNHRGARVVAWADAGRLTVEWDHSLGIDRNHARAAEMLADKLGWGDHPLIGGSLAGAGYAFVTNLADC